MATLKTNNLNLTGSDLLTDAESYMYELSDTVLSQQGGMATPWPLTPLSPLFWTL